MLKERYHKIEGKKKVSFVCGNIDPTLTKLYIFPKKKVRSDIWNVRALTVAANV